MDLDEMLEDEAHWPTVLDLIVSDQIPVERIAEIVLEYPEFNAWWARKQLQ
jgi:hypothetical protein